MNKVKVIVVKDYDGALAGSIFDGTLKNGIWSGIATERCGSFWVDVPAEFIEVYEEEKHDPCGFAIKQYFAKKAAERLEQEERAELKRLKAKYEGSA